MVLSFSLKVHKKHLTKHYMCSSVILHSCFECTNFSRNSFTLHGSIIVSFHTLCSKHSISPCFITLITCGWKTNSFLFMFTSSPNMSKSIDYLTLLNDYRIFCKFVVSTKLNLKNDSIFFYFKTTPVLFCQDKSFLTPALSFTTSDELIDTVVYFQ